MFSTIITDEDEILARELEYHQRLYSGFAQQHFARPAVRAFREHLVQRIRDVTGVNQASRVLSIGCGIGDTELLLAPYVGAIVGVDLSPAAIRQARRDADRLNVWNARFVEGTTESVRGPFDAVVAIFTLHHLSTYTLAHLPPLIARLVNPGGRFYSLDPSKYRASGALGRRLFPRTMKRFQSPDERELAPETTRRLFGPQWSRVDVQMYDFGSTPLAGLLPGWRAGYLAARRLDDSLLRLPFLRRFGSNFEIVARKR